MNLPCGHDAFGASARASGCAVCQLYLTDPGFREALARVTGGGPAPVPASAPGELHGWVQSGGIRSRMDVALACVHRGDPTGTAFPCQVCGRGTVEVATFRCGLHGVCASSPRGTPEGVKNCRDCADRTPPDAADRRVPLLLECRHAPGDYLVMSAAVESLHLAHPGRFRTWVKGPADALYDHNPLIETSPVPGDVERVAMEYPLIHQSDRRPVHFMQGYCDFLADRLGLPVPLAVNRPQLHLHPTELETPPALGQPARYWLLNAGVKTDFTAKQYPYYADVVRLLRGRVRLAQVGERHHLHPPIPGAWDLRGQTSTRDLVRLAAHADGVLTGVSFPMHLAAALQKPCVVVAGGREPRAWNVYPRQVFLSTVGALPCCAGNACWKSRVVPLGDGDEKDRSLCERPVGTDPPAGSCMAMIRPAEVARAVLSYYKGGVLS